MVPQWCRNLPPPGLHPLVRAPMNSSLENLAFAFPTRVFASFAPQEALSGKFENFRRVL
jgi:hypothetical protein